MKINENHPNDFNTIQRDAENNTINLAATPPSATTFQDTLISLHELGKTIEENPKSLLSKVVQWFNRVILRRSTEQELHVEPEEADESIPENPLEPPVPISDEMVNSLIRDFEKLFVKHKNVDSELEELFHGNAESIDHLYNVLVNRLLVHYKNNSDERKISAQIVLGKHDDIAALQTKRKELNENIVDVQKNKQFWDRVNLGCSVALYLFTIANVAVVVIGGFPVTLAGVVGTLQAGAAISSGGSQLVSAGIKKSSNKLMGESISVKENIRTAHEKIDIDMKLLTDSHKALVKVIKNLQQLNEKHHQMLMSLAAMKAY